MPEGGTFAKEHAVTSYDVGPDLRAKASTYLNWLQETAVEAGRARGTTLEGAKEGGRIWVYAGHKLRWLGRARMHDVVVATTWASGVKGVGATREFELTRQGDGATILHAQAYVVCVDRATKRPTPIDEESVRALTVRDASHFRDYAPAAPTSPCEAPLVLEAQRKVQLEELDFSAHMNNAVYLRWAADLLGEGLFAAAGDPRKAPSLADATIKYYAPLLLGDAADLKGTLTGFGPQAAHWSVDIVSRSSGVKAASLRLISDWDDTWNDALKRPR